MNELPADTAILLTEWSCSSSDMRKLCSTLMPLLGKSLLQRSVENLVLLGCKLVHVFLGDNPAPVRELLGNGERWGVQLRYHYLQENDDLPTNLRRLNLEMTSSYWLACDDRVPSVSQPVHENTALYWETASNRHWAGLGRFSGAWLNALQGCGHREDFEHRLASDPALRWTPVACPLSCESDRDFLRSARCCLQPPPAGNHDSIRLGRGVVIHPSAVLTGPVWLGHLVHVGPGVQLGPNAVLEDGAVVDQGATVQDSVVVADTYVGQELNLQHCVAAPGRLANVTQGVVLDELAPMLLTSVQAPRGHPRPAWPQRLALWALKAALLPLWLWAHQTWRRSRQDVPVTRLRVLRSGGSQGETQTLHLANTLDAVLAGEPGALTRHFVYTFYPGLSAVLRGQLVLCGPKLRTAEHVARLPAHWRNLYEQHPCGLLHPSVIQGSSHATEDPYTQDVLTVADASLGWRLRLLGSYLAQLVQELSGSHTRHSFNLTPRK